MMADHRQTTLDFIYAWWEAMNKYGFAKQCFEQDMQYPWKNISVGIKV